MLNHAIGLRDAAGLDAADALYRALGATYWVAVRPDGAEGLAAALADRGFAPDGSWGSSPAASSPRRATDLRVAEVGPAGAEAFGAIAAGAFGLPDDLAGWLAALVGRPGRSCFAAHDGAEPVAVGALYAAGASAWMALGATRPSHRGRGAQPALIAARIRRAAELGCTLVVTETGAPGRTGPGPPPPQHPGRRLHRGLGPAQPEVAGAMTGPPGMP